MGEYLPNFDVEGAPLAPIIFADSLHAKKLCNTLSSIGAPHPNFGGPNLLPTTDVLQATAYKLQHWDWAQTEITCPIFTLRTVIDYYNKRGSTVNLCILNISKAFDKVNHYCMFIKLMNRSVPVGLVLLKVPINWYDKCAVFVRWNNVSLKCFLLLLCYVC